MGAESPPAVGGPLFILLTRVGSGAQRHPGDPVKPRCPTSFAEESAPHLPVWGIMATLTEGAFGTGNQGWKTHKAGWQPGVCVCGGRGVSFKELASNW